MEAKTKSGSFLTKSCGPALDPPIPLFLRRPLNLYPQFFARFQVTYILWFAKISDIILFIAFIHYSYDLLKT